MKDIQRPGKKNMMGLLAAAVLIGGCSHESSTVRQPPVPIVSAEAAAKTIPFEIVSIGSGEAYKTVSIRSQVGGVLSRVYFKEGEHVKTGDRLFLIDPAPFEAALRAAEAKRDRDLATLKYTEESVRRYDELAKKDYITAQEYSNLRTGLETIRATVQSDEADVESARLNLDYCSVESPLNGRMGTLLIDEGNVVRASGDNPMVVIHQIKPMFVRFAVPEQHLPDILKYSATESLEVRAFAPGESPDDRRGSLTFIDNAVDASTGTILLKAEFPNEDLTLWPGEFVNVVLVLKQLENVVVVPAQAVGTGQMGDYVFVVSQDNTVDLRPVTVSYRRDNDAVIENGVQAGERVVVDGQLRLRPGSAVVEKPADTGTKANSS
ncbi:MAG: efflux RND transporter periplasmic adaptor subunit [Chitinivibrionia bacterium]|nr:efflux RND transporter periplasmic adaptor subunit [Chitinivibrionia bacterium]